MSSCPPRPWKAFASYKADTMTVKAVPCRQAPGMGREWAEMDSSNCELPLHHALSCQTKKAGAGGYVTCQLPRLWEAVSQCL